jgi:Zn-dependent peptidase ImmA (M78 family)
VGAVPFAQGYDLAQQVRQALGIPVEPLASMSLLAEEEFGVPVLAGELQAANLLALTAKERDTNLAAIIVNGRRHTNRRVDIAHELGHVLFDAAETDIDYWLDLENDHETETSKAEQRANAFAAELLIPRKGLVETFGPAHERGRERYSLAASRDLARRVAEHFHTPPELTTNHLVNHMYIADELRDAVRTELSIPPWRPPGKRPQMLHRRLAEALQAGLITQIRALELLGLSARDTLPPDVRPS